MPSNLYRRGKSKVWWGRIKLNGRDVRESLRTTNGDEARRRLKALRDRLNHVRFTGEDRHTWKAIVAKWLLEYAPDAIRPGTLKRYQVSLRQLRPFLDHLFLDEINRKVIVEIITRRKAADVTNATIRRDLSALSSVLTYATGIGWREDNPAREFDRRVIKERRPPRELPGEDHIAFVVARAPGNFARMVRFAQYTGMREEEIASLERPQISRQRKAVELTKTKTNRPRSVPLDDRAWGTIEGTPPALHCQWIFWHDNGGAGARYQNVSSRFAQIVSSAAEAAEKAKKPFKRFTFHDLRHWYAVDYLRAGGNIYDLQKILGHASIKTTELYLDYLKPDEQQRAKYGAQKGAQV